MVCRGKDLNKLIYYGREYLGGARYEGRTEVPPVYRSVKSPVGRYCAIEAYPGIWGVMAIDGNSKSLEYSTFIHQASFQNQFFPAG